MKFRIERLTSAHDCRKFRCGEHTLDNFLLRHALANDARGLGTTYVAVAQEAGSVLGYVTLCSGAVYFEHIPNEVLPRYPIPTLLIARLGVDRAAQSLGVGTSLVLAALKIAVEVAEQVGVYAVTVEALTPQAKAFYQRRFGFQELLDDPLHLFVTIADLRASGV